MPGYMVFAMQDRRIEQDRTLAISHFIIKHEKYTLAQVSSVTCNSPSFHEDSKLLPLSWEMKPTMMGAKWSGLFGWDGQGTMAHRMGGLLLYNR